jgi:DNA-directed RNA polymerase specialized sigma subunit
MTERRNVATYRWDGRAWIVQFRDPDIATFGRTLAAAKRHARSALAVYLEVSDLDDPGADVVDDVRLPAGVADDVRAVVDRRAKVEALRAEVAEATKRAAADLRAAGLSTRDVGEILGVSGARVAQIERAARDSDGREAQRFDT